MIHCNDGMTITHSGSFIHVSNGDTYSLCGTTLTGPGFVSYNVTSINEAVNIICGLHGGKRF